MKQQQSEAGNKELRNFGLITGAIVVGLFGLLQPWLTGHTWPVWPGVVAAVLAVCALTIPATLRPVFRGWMAFGQAAGWINTRIILGIIFYFIITPIGLVKRLVAKDPMARVLGGTETSYRVPSHAMERDRMRRPF